MFDAAIERGVRVVCNTWGLPWREPVERRVVGVFSDQTVELYERAGGGRRREDDTREVPFVRGKTVLDLCCGGGIQGLTAAALGATFVRLVEMNPRAARFARANAALNGQGSSVEVVEGDATEVAVGGGREWDVVLINPPYIPNDGAPDGSLTAFGDGGA